VLGKPGQLDQIIIRDAKGYSPEQVRDNVSKMLGPKYETITGKTDSDRTAQAITNAMGFFSTALMVFGGIALFVGAFIIFNTFSILVAQRVREFGLLRALGASTAQVTMSVLVEALVVGVVSSVAGILLGFGIALGLYQVLGAFGIDMPSTTLQFQARTGIVAFAVGVGVTLIAAAAPALRTRLVSPMAALSAGYATHTPGGVRRRLLVGVPLTLLGLGALLFGMFGGTSQPLLFLGGGGVVVFVGVSSLSALVARPMASVLGWPFQRLFGVPGKLGRENAMRSPARTARTAAALMIGLALVSFVSIFGASLKASSMHAVDSMMRMDYLVQPQNQMQAGFSPDLAAGISTVPGVGTVAEMRGGRWLRDGNVELVGAADPYAIEQAFDITVDQGDLTRISSISGVAVAKSTASRLGMHLGDVLTVTMPKTGTQKLPIVAVYESGGFGVEYIISLPLFVRSFPQQLDSMVGVKLQPNADRAAVGASIDKLVAAYPNAKVENTQQFKDSTAKSIDQLLGLIYTLLVLAVVISLFGIVNTLALSVFERVRELGLLRAVGMTKPDVRRMIRWESVTVALIGALLGMVVGSVFGWLAVYALRDQGFGVFSYPVVQLVVFLALAGLAGVVAAIGPARRASKVDVLEAIATT
jgi:putative ABC transport system permease protein